MCGQRMFLRGRILAVLFGVGLSLWPLSAAWADVLPSTIDTAPIAYQPKMLASLDDIAKAFSSNRDNYAWWCSEGPAAGTTSYPTQFATGKVTKITLSRTHLEFWGTGPVAPIAEVVLDTADIASVEIYQDSALKGEPFPVAVKIVPQKRDFPLKTYWLRALNLDTAKTLVDGFATLAAVGSGSLKIEDHGAPPSFGIAARDLTPEEKKAAAVDSGIYVGGVDTGSPAAQMGIQSGDYLLEINGAKIAGLDGAKKMLSAAAVTSVKVWRKGNILPLNSLTNM